MSLQLLMKYLTGCWQMESKKIMQEFSKVIKVERGKSDTIFT